MSNPRCIPANVLTLKNKVPASWTSAASRSALRSGPGVAVSCRYDADVNPIEPTKNVTPIAGREADAHWEANDASAKQTDPAANSTPIHQPLRAGRHQLPASAGEVTRPCRARAPGAARARA